LDIIPWQVNRKWKWWGCILYL